MMTMNLIASRENSAQPTAWDTSKGRTIPRRDSSPRPSSSFGGASVNTEPPITLSPGQAAAVDLIQSGANVFLSGMAGTGKSTALLQYIGQAFRRVDVCATTGIAALNLQDQFRKNAGVGIPAYTIYRWSGMALGPAPGQRFEDYLNFLCNGHYGRMPISRIAAFSRVKAAECLVIDEISMLPGRIIDYLDFHCRALRGVERPFGGIQVVAVGDFLQLPPVAKNGKYDWAFASQAWRDASFCNAYLTEIHRQKEPPFTEALNSFREGQISKSVADTLSSRVKMFVDRSVVRLMTHNAQVDKWNDYNIGEIEKPEVVFEAIKNGPEAETDFLIKNMITPEVLTLKEGARVMVTSNLIIRGGKFFDRFDEESYKEWQSCGNQSQFDIVNGQCGKVTGFGNDSVFVLIDGSQDSIEICRNTWVFDPSRDGKKELIINCLEKNQIDSLEEEPIRVLRCGWVEQIPLRPAYALTIHKSQGLTLNSAHIDIRAAREPGQAYVALSRLRSLSGLYLKDWIKGVHVSEAAINFYKNLQ